MTGGALLEVALATLGAKLGGLSGLSLGWLRSALKRRSWLARCTASPSKPRHRVALMLTTRRMSTTQL
jgi:hypothetical protein